MQKALLVFCSNNRYQHHNLIEFIQLVESANVDYTFVFRFNVREINHKTYLSKGLVEFLQDHNERIKPDIIIFNESLQPKHQRNLVKLLCACPIIDMNELILDIFAKRARTHIGKLQVELAQLQHLSTRLVGGWTHLERQKGGIGLRGPGEKQLETDRRLLRKRITRLQGELSKSQLQLSENRKKRSQSNSLQVALVGYTNAGKTTLFNTLTESNAYAQDQLFATLDPLIRRIKKLDYPILISDTVGFMTCLPDILIEAFQATLDELHYADIILHVIDSSDPDYEHRVKVVTKILTDMDIPSDKIISIYNKADKGNIPPFEPSIHISALTGHGIEKLNELIEQKFLERFKPIKISINHQHMDLINQIYKIAPVHHTEHLHEESVFEIFANPEIIHKIKQLEHAKIVT